MKRTKKERKRSRARGSIPHRAGFTLLELVVVMTMLVVVLVTSYKILTNTLETERHVERLTLPEKVGEGMTSLFRHDLAGVFYRGLTEQLNRQVFMGVSNGSEGAWADDVRFLTTAEPTSLQGGATWEEDVKRLRTVTAVAYFLQENPNIPGFDVYKLYRKEVTDFTSGDVLGSPGLNLEVYDKVKSFKVEYFDGYEWLSEWSSELQIEARENAMLEQVTAIEEGRTQDVAGSVVDDTTENITLPPAAIPSAVRIELEIYAGRGNELFELNGEPIVRRFRTIVHLFAATRFAMQVEDEFGDGTGESGVGGEGARGGGISTNDPGLVDRMLRSSRGSEGRRGGRGGGSGEGRRGSTRGSQGRGTPGQPTAGPRSRLGGSR